MVLYDFRDTFIYCTVRQWLCRNIFKSDDKDCLGLDTVISTYRTAHMGECSTTFLQIWLEARSLYSRINPLISCLWQNIIAPAGRAPGLTNVLMCCFVPYGIGLVSSPLAPPPPPPPPFKRLSPDEDRSCLAKVSISSYVCTHAPYGRTEVHTGYLQFYRQGGPVMA